MNRILTDKEMDFDWTDKDGEPCDTLEGFTRGNIEALLRKQADISYGLGQEDVAREILFANMTISEHIIQDDEGNWLIESHRIKEWFKEVQALKAKYVKGEL